MGLTQDSFAQQKAQAHVRFVVIDGLGQAKEGTQTPEFDAKSKGFSKILNQANLQFAKYVCSQNIQTILTAKAKRIDLGNDYRLIVMGRLTKLRVVMAIKIVKIQKVCDQVPEIVVLIGRISPKFGQTQSICLPMPKDCCKKILIVTVDNKPIKDPNSKKLE